MTRYFTDIRIEGNEDDLASFGTLAAFINECKVRGHCGTIKVTVDGDGSASLWVKEKNQDGEYSLIEFPPGKEEEALETWENNSLWIGE